jgi:hypothetical protein
MAGIQFAEFKSTVAKLCHMFTCIPAGMGLLSPCIGYSKHGWILCIFIKITGYSLC